MKVVAGIALLVLLISQPAKGCGNEYEEYDDIWNFFRRNENNSVAEPEPYDLIHGFRKKELNEWRETLKNDLKEKYDYQKESDYGLILLKLGEVKEALAIFKKLVKKHPEEYSIVANLGTAYELNGKDDSALYYIKKAVKINPHSHQGSEWIHVRILEAKVIMKKNPDYLQQNSILSLDLRPDKKYSDEERQKFIRIKEELYWQLKERVAFVPAPDPVVADLLLTLANLIAITEENPELSFPAYQQSIQYHPSWTNHVLQYRDQVVVKMHQDTVVWWYGFSTCLILVVLVFLVVRFNQKKKKKTQQEAVPVFSSVHIEK